MQDASGAVGKSASSLKREQALPVSDLMRPPDQRLTLAQLAKINKEIEGVQNEFEAIKDHLDSYVTASNPAPPAIKSAKAGRQPTRHISHLTQMAAKALGRDVDGLCFPQSTYSSCEAIPCRSLQQ